MDRWGTFIGRRAGSVLAAAIVLFTVAAAYGIGVFGALSDGGFDDPASESHRELVIQQTAFPDSVTDLVLIYSSTELTVNEPAFREAVEDVVGRLPGDEVASTTTWYTTKAASLVSDDKHSTRVLVTLEGTDEETKGASYDGVKGQLAADGLKTEVAGAPAVFEDVNAQVSTDIARAEALSMPIVLMVSFVIFGSLVAALMPTLVGVFAVVGAFALVRLLTEITDVSVFSINVITLIGMGLAIDYALFVVSRFREELAQRPGTGRDDVAVAITQTMTSAGRTVLFSGVIVAGAMSSLLSLGWYLVHEVQLSKSNLSLPQHILYSAVR